MFNKNRFTSQRDAMSRAKKQHVCVSCLFSQPTTFKICPQCQSDLRVFFPSRAEHLRAVQLIQMQKAGQISRLQFHQRFDLVVEGTKICAYEADSCYIENGKQIVEDVKAGGTDFMDKVASMKIDLFNAINKKHGLSVKIYRRK